MPFVSKWEKAQTQMPIEINEVVVRVSVDDRSAPPASDAPPAPGATAVAKSTDEAVEQMLQILREKQER